MFCKIENKKAKYQKMLKMFFRVFYTVLKFYKKWYKHHFVTTFCNTLKKTTLYTIDKFAFI